MAEQWDALEREFAETGVCVVRGVLSGDQVHAMRDALAADREEHASEWNIFGRSRDGGPIGESGRWQSNNIMLHSEAYDAVVAGQRAIGGASDPNAALQARRPASITAVGEQSIATAEAQRTRPHSPVASWYTW